MILVDITAGFVEGNINLVVDIIESVEATRPNEVHLLCCFPGVQQIIGIFTVFSNACKSSLDAISHVEDIAIKYKWAKGLPYQERQKLRIEADIRSYEEEDYIEKIRERYRSNERDLPRHLFYIFVGIIRAIPVLGTIYSVSRLYVSDVRPLNC